MPQSQPPTADNSPHPSPLTEEALERARSLTTTIEEAIEAALVDGDTALANALEEVR